MSKQKEVPLATAVTVTREVRIKNLKPLKNYTPYALKTSHFPPHLFHLLLPNSFGPYECSQAAVLTPESCLRSEVGCIALLLLLLKHCFLANVQGLGEAGFPC